MLLRNMTDKTPHPKTFTLTSEVSLAPGEAVCCDKLRKLPGWEGLDHLISQGLLAYEEEPKPVVTKPKAKKAAAEVKPSEESKPKSRGYSKRKKKT